MTAREMHVAGVALLIRSLTDRLAVARALKDRDFVALAGASALAHAGVSPALAAKDPARYRALSHAVMLFHLRGHTVLDPRRLSDMAKRGASPRARTTAVTL